MKQLGVDITGKLGTGTAVVNFNTNNPFASAPLSATSILGGFDTNLGRVEATIRAMERAGVIRTLAEPNLSAISGESANFLAGGEFPVITGSTCNPPGSFNCTASVTFKKFGVSLSYTPTVLANGRISLPGHPSPGANWSWHCAPLDEWDGTIPQWDPVANRQRASAPTLD
jgi:pilus assembly protein CpaC